MIVYNTFLFPWRVPSMNDLMQAKSITGKKAWIQIGKQKKTSFIYNQYNEIKQDWSKKVCYLVKKQGFLAVESCYFTYMVIEHDKTRDPSNVFASAIKFIEDALQLAGVIENDGWKQVLGIRSYIYLDRESTGAVMLVMADQHVEEKDMIELYARPDKP